MCRNRCYLPIHETSDQLAQSKELEQVCTYIAVSEQPIIQQEISLCHKPYKYGLYHVSQTPPQ